jgi:hypothetical protein
VDAWVWFLIAAVAGIAGVALLLIDRGQHGVHSRERRRWAALRGWQFAYADPVLPGQWQHGAMARGGNGTARDVVTGSLFTTAGRRQVHVFDYERGGSTVSVVTAVHQLWLPTVEFPDDAELDLVGPVGDRYAFASDMAKARPLITPELVALADDVGDDVPVVWIEGAWVAAAASPGTLPARLERLLRMLGDLADLIDGAQSDESPSEDTAPKPAPDGPKESPA